MATHRINFARATTANKKRPTLISDCPDSMIGQVSLLALGGQNVQFIQVHTEGPYKCALCPANGVDFWTINKPFATSDGGPLLPPYALVCPQHGPAIQQTASDYAAAVKPEPVDAEDTDAEDTDAEDTDAEDTEDNDEE